MKEGIAWRLAGVKLIEVLPVRLCIMTAFLNSRRSSSRALLHRNVVIKHKIIWGTEMLHQDLTLDKMIEQVWCLKETKMGSYAYT